jgi:hypothetical protein
MINLGNPQLRRRDITRILRLGGVVWDAGIEATNEWVYASVESDAHRTKLLDWLRSKGIGENEEAICFDSSSSIMNRVLWRDLIDKPELFFREASFKAVSLNKTWTIEYVKEGVARFGRWNTK